MAVDISEEDFKKEVIEKSEKEKVVVDFWAPWCAPCRMLGPRLEEVCEQEEVRLVKVNVDENPGIARQFEIRGIPAVKIFSSGEVVAEFTGAQPENVIRETINQ